MGSRGPAPTPSRILELKGSRRAAGRKDEPRPANARPRCPKWLKPEAKREWRRQVRQLESLGMAAEMDRALLAAWCAAWAEWVEVEATLAKTGLLAKTSNGNVVQNPLVGIRNRCVERMVKLAGQFGFSPAARARLANPGDGGEEANPFLEFMKNGAAVDN